MPANNYFKVTGWGYAQYVFFDSREGTAEVIQALRQAEALKEAYDAQHAPHGRATIAVWEWIRKLPLSVRVVGLIRDTDAVAPPSVRPVEPAPLIYEPGTNTFSRGDA